MTEKTPAIQLKSLKIDTIDTTSGVFIGINRVTSWTSYSKTNSGFGTSGPHSHDNINTVYDNDFIDAPAESRDLFLQTEGCTNNDGVPLEIKFDKIDVNALDTQSIIAVGNNSQSAWDSHSKENYGLGTLYGRPGISKNTNTINDNDVIDAPINNHDIKPVFIRRSKD